jgi:hypothetical protein
MKGTSTSGMPLAKSMPSPKTLLPTSQLTCDSKTSSFFFIFIYFIFPADVGKSEICFFFFFCFFFVGCMGLWYGMIWQAHIT